MLEKRSLIQDVGIMRISELGENASAVVVGDEAFNQGLFVVGLVPNPFVVKHALQDFDFLGKTADDVSESFNGSESAFVAIQIRFCDSHSRWCVGGIK